MATAEGIAPGTPIGIREAARRYRIDHSLLSRWARSGKVAIVDGRLDEASLIAALTWYKPHRDNRLRNGGNAPGRATRKPRDGPGKPLQSPRPVVASPSTQGIFLPVGTLVTAFYDAHPTWSFRTLEFYSRNLSPFTKAFRHLPTTPEPIESYLAQLHAKASPTGYQHTWRCLRTFYRWLGRRYLLANPLEQIDPPRQKRKLPDYYTENELRAIMETARATDETQDYAMMRLFIYTGIRAGELALLRPEQVYPDHIRVDGKTGEGIVPIDQGTHEALKPLLHRGLPYVFPARAGGQFDGSVEGKRRGLGTKRKGFEPTAKALRKRGLYDRVSRIIRASGVEVKGRKTGAHVLRHSFARLMLAKTGDLRLVQRLLRHSSIATTQIYTHLAQEDVNRKYQEQVAEWLKG